MPASSNFRKAVIPVAGMGTRLLPLTKAQPKEMLPVGNKPLIQHVVEEAAASGIRQVILVTLNEKSSIAEHFQRNPLLERFLEEHGKYDEATMVREISSIADITCVHQDYPRGLADAILCAREALGDEPFAVLLPDVLVDAAVPCTAQLVDCYRRYRGSVIAVRTVERERIPHHGMLAVSPVPGTSPAVWKVSGLAEKPAPEASPSSIGIFGRYLLTPEIFDFIEKTPAGFGNEIQITDSLDLYCHSLPLYGLEFEGLHYDAGDKPGLLVAMLAFASKDPEMAPALQASRNK